MNQALTVLGTGKPTRPDRWKILRRFRADKVGQSPGIWRSRSAFRIN